MMSSDGKCLYCGNLISWESKLAGQHRFCSPEHLALYTNETRQRLIQAVAKNSIVRTQRAVSTKFAQWSASPLATESSQVAKSAGANLASLTATQSPRIASSDPSRLPIPCSPMLASGDPATFPKPVLPELPIKPAVLASPVSQKYHGSILEPRHRVEAAFPDQLSGLIHKPRLADFRVGLHVIPARKTSIQVELSTPELTAFRGRPPMILATTPLAGIGMLGVDEHPDTTGALASPDRHVNWPLPLTAKPSFYRPGISARSVPARDLPLKRACSHVEGVFVPRIHLGVLMPRGSFTPKTEAGFRGKGRPATIPINSSRPRSTPRAG